METSDLLDPFGKGGLEALLKQGVRGRWKSSKPTLHMIDKLLRMPSPAVLGRLALKHCW